MTGLTYCDAVLRCRHLDVARLVFARAVLLELFRLRFFDELLVRLLPVRMMCVVVLGLTNGYGTTKVVPTM